LPQIFITRASTAQIVATLRRRKPESFREDDYVPVGTIIHFRMKAFRPSREKANHKRFTIALRPTDPRGPNAWVALCMRRFEGFAPDMRTPTITATIKERDFIKKGPTNDGSVAFMNKTGGFQTLQQVFENYQPLKERGLINAPADPRTDGTRQLYFAQQWGRNAIFINTDCRTYRDIRMKTAANADETGARTDNPNRTMLGATQLAWLEQTLLAAQRGGPTWKFINISDPIDQIGPIGGILTLNNAPTTAEYGTLGSITSITTTADSSGKTVTVASTVGLVVGQPVSGANVADGTKIASINTDGTTFTLNNSPTPLAIPSGTTLRLAQQCWRGGARYRTGTHHRSDWSGGLRPVCRGTRLGTIQQGRPAPMVGVPARAVPARPCDLPATPPL